MNKKLLLIMSLMMLSACGRVEDEEACNVVQASTEAAVEVQMEIEEAVKEEIVRNQEKYREELISVPGKKIVVKSQDAEDAYVVYKVENEEIKQYTVNFYKTESEFDSGLEDAGIFTEGIVFKDDKACYVECLSIYQPSEYGETYDDLWAQNVGLIVE